jgi:hypothetical protein
LGYEGSSRSPNNSQHVGPQGSSGVRAWAISDEMERVVD